MTHSITVWNLSRRPNYDTNIDKLYPYSEVPYIGQYHLVKLPINNDNLIEHVDYWGEGRINATEGISGFTDCYNVNHHYQLVSNGPDKDRKIPNRIPVISYTNCDTSSYIKDNSVKLVTLMGAPINKSCARDIARMVNIESGKVVIFDFSENSPGVKNLEEELKKKEMLHSPDDILPDMLKGLTLYDSHRSYYNLTELKKELHRHIVEGNYVNAIQISRSLNGIKKGDKITATVTQLLDEKQMNIMAYAYQLWNADAKDIVKNNFPSTFTLLFQGDFVKIVNKKFLVTLKINVDLDDTRKDLKDNNLSRDKFKITPVFENNNLYFKIHNTEHEKFLRLDEKQGGHDVQVNGAENVDSKSEWLLEPKKMNGDLIFFIVNRQFNKALKLDDGTDKDGEKQLVGSSAVTDQPETFGWLISPFDTTYEYLTKPASQRKK